MGNLSRFKLKRYIDAYRLDVLFETGTFRGGGVRAALDAGFRSVYSSEIMSDAVSENRRRFAGHPNVRILEGHSPEAIASTLPEISGNICFWLDAHFPGGDASGDYNVSAADESLNYPLEAELEAVTNCRDASSDVFLIDDLRIYEDGPFQCGNTPDWIIRPKVQNIDFVFRLFADSHHIVRRYEDNGYLLLLPKAQKPKVFMNIKLGERVRRLLA